MNAPQVMKALPWLLTILKSSAVAQLLAHPMFWVISDRLRLTAPKLPCK